MDALALFRELQGSCGNQARRDKTVEECYELIEALKFLIGVLEAGVDSKETICDSIMHIYGEMADVLVTTDSLFLKKVGHENVGMMYDYKIERTVKRFKNGMLN